MAKQTYTVILVPHAAGRFRKLHFSRPILALIGSCLILGTVAAGVLGFHYLQFYEDLKDLRHVRSINAELRRQNLDYEVSVEHLSERVGSLQDFVKKLTMMAGLAGELEGAGVGGPADYEPTSRAFAEAMDSIQQMAGDLTSLEEKSRVLELFYEQNSLMLASTPSIWPVRGYVSSTYGYRKDPFTGKREFHHAVDVSTPVGRPVVATADGLVIHVGEKGSYGKIIVIDHKFGMMTRYAHLSRFNVRTGAKVRRGDVVGYVGSTGRSSAPHLHYEVWVSGRTVHPLNYILEYAKTYMANNLRPPAPDQAVAP